MLIDNKKNGKVGAVLKQNIHNNSRLSIISGYFTLYAFAELKKELNKAIDIRLLFNAPIFKNTAFDHRITGETEEIKFKNQLQQTRLARECADWLKSKVKASEVKVQGAIPFNLFHIDNGNENKVIQGSSNFSSSGLGSVHSSAFHMNTLISDSGATVERHGIF